MAQKEGYSAYQVSALCSLAFAEGLQQKYSLQDAVFDTFVGMVDDVGDSGLESDNLVMNIAGLLFKSTAALTKYRQYESCKKNYTREFYEPYRKWNEAIYFIDNEPNKIFNECKKYNSEKNNLFESISLKQDYLAELKTINSNMKQSLEKIKNQQLRIYPQCNP